jgi:hypothetical protein
MFNQKAILILFINRNTFQLFGGNLTGVVTVEVSENILRDGDIISADGIYTLIKQLVKQYVLAGSQLFIVLSDLMYYEKTFSAAQSIQLENDVLNFFNVVPYESLLTKVYDIEKGKRAVAVNKLLYEAIWQGFTLQGIPTKAIIPACVLGAVGTKHVLDAAMANEIVKNIDGLTRQSLLDTGGGASVAPSQPEDVASPTKKKSQMPLLLGVFGTLIAILVVVILMQPH